MNETDVRRAAKKIQSAQTFQELHEIIMAYAKLYEYKQTPSAVPNPPDSGPTGSLHINGPGSFYNARLVKYGFKNREKNNEIF